MNPPGPGAGASERLDRSRLAILEYLQRRAHGDAATDPSRETPQPLGAHDGASPWRGVREAGRRYWAGHPARLLARLASPLLAHWGRRHPAAFLGAAATLGVLLVLARPWRLISLTGLLVAALKSPHLASLLMTALASGRAGLRKRHRP